METASRQDIRGSVTNVVDSDGALGKSYIYSAYGSTQAGGTFSGSFAYTGALLDEETGLTYMNARYYDSESGRFISEDTYRGDGEEYWHLYAYCEGDPVNYTDPTGHALLAAGTLFGIANSWNPVGWVILGAVVIGGAIYYYAEHTKNKRPSTKNKHQNANERRQREQEAARQKREKIKNKNKAKKETNKYLV